ncbi:MAG: T9SS type A sorting domain-containing protein [Candidatus Kapaibacterium sp.]
MKTALLLLALLIPFGNSEAQWRKIADFWTTDDLGNTIREYVTDVYFLDLPGPPRIGFAGTLNELWKTTDGGASWTSCWQGSGGDVWDICFKDSLTGWFVYEGLGIYRTVDGGNSWSMVPRSFDIFFQNGIHYCASTNRLLFDIEKPYSTYIADTLLSSTDMGNTWNFIAPFYASYFSFSSDYSGIAASIDHLGTSDWTNTMLYTFDGGVTWTQSQDTFPSNFIIQPLAILGTSTCFAVTAARIYVYRSDDYGKTWRQLYDFGPGWDSTHPSLAPLGRGIIQGDLSRLYVGSDSGMLLSTDEGVTWLRDGGPRQAADGYSHGFYAGKGVTICGWWNYDSGFVASDGLWEEEWPQSGVAEQEPSSPVLRIFPNPASNSIRVEPAAEPVTIYDPLGRVYKVPVQGSTLDISSLPAGVYYLSDGYERAKLVKE